MKITRAIIGLTLLAAFGGIVSEATSVLSIAAINAVTQAVINSNVQTNDVFNLQALGLTSPSQINFASFSDATTQSVVFSLNLAKNFRTETAIPHALCGDLNGLYLTCPKLTLGQITVGVTPFSGPSGSGVAGTPMSVTIFITDSVMTPPVAPPIMPPVIAPVAMPVAMPTSTSMLPIRINVGGANVNIEGILWGTDTKYMPPGLKQVFKNCTGTIEGTTLDALFCTERYFPGAPGTVSTFNIPAPAGSYTVNLMFAETFYTRFNRRRFRVTLQDRVIKSGLDIFAMVGGNFLYTQSNTVVVGATGTIKIQFENQLQFAKLNAIEILPM